MKAPRILLLFSMLYCSTCLAQNMESSHKPHIEFWAGMAHRITPIYLNNKAASEDILNHAVNGTASVNADKQLSGTAFSVGLAYLIEPVNVWLSFEYDMRYDHLYYDNMASSGISKSVNGIVQDYHFRLFKSFYVRGFMIKPGLGFSLMNRGTNYYQNNSGGGTDADFNINPFDISVGTELDRLSLDVRCYFIDNHNYLPPSAFIFIPEVKFTYRFVSNKNSLNQALESTH